MVGPGSKGRKTASANKKPDTKKDEKSTCKQTGTSEKDGKGHLQNTKDEGGEALLTTDEETSSSDDMTDGPRSQSQKNLKDVQKSHKDPEKVDKAAETHLGYVIIPIIVAFLALASVWPFSNNTAVHNDIQTGLEKLFEDFKNQTARSNRKLRSRVLPYLEHKTSPQPFVLMVGAMQKDRHTANCFAARVGKLINSEPVVINGSQYSDVESDETKLQIDKKLQEAFQRYVFPTVAIIHNLEALPYSASDLFYKYCDHDHPRYKEAAIIFTVILPQSYDSMLSTSNEIEKEGMVEEYLSKDSQWAKDEKFDENIMGALLSRISDTVIVLSSESQESLQNFC